MLEERIYSEYLAILKEELVPALGCTEPIAIAFAAAKARELLGCLPEKITAYCSGNIIKNTASVIVPGTGHMKGIEASAVIGAVAGDASKKLEVLDGITEDDLVITKQLLAKNICTVKLLEAVSNLQIIIEMQAGPHTALAEVAFAHTNIVRLEKDGKVVFQKQMDAHMATETDRNLLNLRDIYEFANEVRIDDVQPILERQLACNIQIAKEGLENNWGTNVGSTILKHFGNSIESRARALPAAGSDARMSGCVLPVVVNSGSGNQGLTVSLPVYAYADYLGVSKETEYRALTFSNLIAIYQKNELGKLSAYCGAVSASVGAGAAIAYLFGDNFDVICNVITNILGNTSGIVCDGAKPSCAAKIASAMDAAITGVYMARDGNYFKEGEGLVKDNVENTFRAYGRMGREGMRSTDVEILNIMIGK